VRSGQSRLLWRARKRIRGCRPRPAGSPLSARHATDATLCARLRAGSTLTTMSSTSRCPIWACATSRGVCSSTARCSSSSRARWRNISRVSHSTRWGYPSTVASFWIRRSPTACSSRVSSEPTLLLSIWSLVPSTLRGCGQDGARARPGPFPRAR